MGVISDGMPHLWGKLLAGSFTQETPEGGAVLEFRIRYHQPLILGARYSIQSGLLHFGAKVYNFAHMIFDLDRGNSVCFGGSRGGAYGSNPPARRLRHLPRGMPV